MLVAACAVFGAGAFAAFARAPADSWVYAGFGAGVVLEEVTVVAACAELWGL